MSDYHQHSLHTGSVVVILLLLLLATGCKPSAGSLNQDGNEAFDKGDYTEALADYQQAQTAEPETAEPYYNAANTLYRQEAYNDAQNQLQQALQHAQGGDLSQNGLYNLGNSYYNAQQLDAAIAAYREALLLNSDDQDAKYNLELALQQKQEQEQQQQNQDQQPDQDDQNQAEPTPQADEQPTPEPNGQPTSQPDEQATAPANGQPTPQPGDEPPDQQQGQNGQDQAQSQPTPPTEGLTPEQAQQLLSAVSQNSQTLQQKLQQIYTVSQPSPAEDW